MSISGLNQQYIPNTLDGLSIVDADQIYIDGQLVNLSDYVPYQSATKTVDLNSQIIKTSHTATTSNELVNKGLLDTTINGLVVSIAGSFLDKVTTTPQTVIGNVSYTAQLSSDNFIVPETKEADLAGVVQVSGNYRRLENDAGVTANYRFGSITSSLGVYQATTTGNFASLGLATVTVGKRYKLNINVLGDIASYTSSIQLYASIDGQNPTQSLGPSAGFTPSSTIFQLLTGTFVPAYQYLILLCINASPTGVGLTVKWFGLEMYETGVELEKVTLPLLTASKVPILNSNKQLVASGTDASKLDYLDNVSSDIQTQLNSKLNLSGSNANQNIVIGSYKVQSTATPTIADDLTRKGYVDGAIAAAGAAYVLKAGDTMTGTLAMGANKITTTYTPVNADDLTRKGYVDTQLALKANLAGPQTFSGTHTFSNVAPINLSALTGNRLLGLGVGKDIDTVNVTLLEAFQLSGVTGNIQNQLNAKASLIGPQTFTGTHTFDSATPINLSFLTGQRALIIGPSKNVEVSVTTSAELAHLSGTTSSVQNQLDGKVNDTGDVMTGTLGISGTNVIEFGSGIVGKDSNAGKIGYQTFTTGCLDVVGAGTSSTDRRVRIWDKLGVGTNPADTTLQVAGTGSFTGSVGIGTTTPRAILDVSGDIITSWSNSRIGTQFDTTSSGYYLGMITNVSTRELYLDAQSSDVGGSGAIILRTGSGPAERVRIDKDGQMANAVTGNTLYNLKFVNTASHIDNNAGEVFLFTGFQGHLAIGRNETRNSTTANLCLGVASTEEAQIISTKTDNSGYMPMSFASSQYTFTSGNIGVKRTTAPYSGINFTNDGTGISWGTGSTSYSRIFDDAQLRIITDDNMYFYTGGSAIAPFTYGNLAMYIDNQSAPRIGVGTDAPAYRLDVNGTGRIRNELYVGTEGNASSTIYLGGQVGDAQYEHAVIESRTYTAGTENTELLLFKGNDVIGPSGPDRIRLRANEICLDTYDGATNNRTAESIRMTVKQDGNVGINIRDPLSQLDINRTPARTGTHGSGLGLYVTNGGNTIAEFRDPNGSQGIGIGYNRIYATGSNADQDIQLYARGSGQLRHEARTHEWWANGSGLAFSTMKLLSDGMLEMANAITITGNTTTANSQQFSLRTNGPTFIADNVWGYGTGGNGVLQVGAINSSQYGGRAQDSISCRAWNDGNWIITFSNSAGSIRGQIAGVNSSSVAYNTSSDKRLKDCIHPIEGALDIVQKLEPVHFRWKNDDEYDFGFIAQDVYKVLPHMRPNLTNYIKECSCKRQDICNGVICGHCQTLNDEPVDEEGKPRYYSLDYGRFTPYLVGAVQEIVKQSTLQSEIVQELHSVVTLQQQSRLTEEASLRKHIQVLEERNKVLEAWARDSEAKTRKMEERMEKMASLLAQLISK